MKDFFRNLFGMVGPVLGVLSYLPLPKPDNQPATSSLDVSVAFKQFDPTELGLTAPQPPEVIPSIEVVEIDAEEFSANARALFDN